MLKQEKNDKAIKPELKESTEQKIKGKNYLIEARVFVKKNLIL